MKWSEQMRELLSVDENFNQLEFDIDTHNITINGEFIAKAVINQVPSETTSVSCAVNYKDYKKIIKKYPFFTDENFLLHCVFKYEEGGYKVLEKTKYVCINETEIKMCSHSGYYLYIKTANVSGE